MPSRALQNWQTVAAAHLDEMETAHASIGGTARGRRYATQQINRAYAVLLSSQFQAFCRDLHSEAVDHLVSAVKPSSLESIVRANLTRGRKLDRGNPTPGHLGEDFGRLEIKFWDELRTHDARTTIRKRRLEELNQWRNAIAHQDFDPRKLGGRTLLRLSEVRAWRKACQGLAKSFDGVVALHVKAVVGSLPW